MECLTPIKSREPLTRGLVVSKFTWLVIALALGAAIGGAALIDWRTVGDAIRHHPLLQAELAIVIGAFPAFVLSRGLVPHPWARPRSLDRYYRTLVTAVPPPAAGYTHYLPCALLERGPIDPTRITAPAKAARRPVVSGILYAGPDGICFRPYAAPKSGPAEPPAPRALVDATAQPTPDAFDIGPVRMVTAAAVKIDHPSQRPDPQSPPEYAMLMEWPTGQALFAVPSIGDTLPRLHDCLDTLRWDGETSD